MKNDLILDNNDDKMVFLPEMLRSIIVNDGEVEKVGEAIHIKGKLITLNYMSNTEIIGLD